MVLSKCELCETGVTIAAVLLEFSATENSRYVSVQSACRCNSKMSLFSDENGGVTTERLPKNGAISGLGAPEALARRALRLRRCSPGPGCLANGENGMPKSWRAQIIQPPFRDSKMRKSMHPDIAQALNNNAQIGRIFFSFRGNLFITLILAPCVQRLRALL